MANDFGPFGAKTTSAPMLAFVLGLIALTPIDWSLTNVDRIALLKSELATAPQHESDLAFARRAHALLHQRVLRTYDPAASDVAQTWNDGQFNCVSATLLMIELVESSGRMAAARQCRGHVWCVVFSPEGELEIEMTRPQIFLRPRPSDFYGDGNSRGQVRTVTGAALRAMASYNRAVTLSGRGEYFAAVLTNLEALALDPSSPWARESLLATLNNWSVSLNKRQPLGSWLILQAGLAVDPDYPPLRQNLRLFTDENGRK